MYTNGNFQNKQLKDNCNWCCRQPSAAHSACAQRACLPPTVKPRAPLQGMCRLLRTCAPCTIRLCVQVEQTKLESELQRKFAAEMSRSGPDAGAHTAVLGTQPHTSLQRHVNACTSNQLQSSQRLARHAHNGRKRAGCMHTDVSVVCAILTTWDIARLLYRGRHR